MKTLLASILALAMTSTALAQPAWTPKKIAIKPEPNAIPLYAGITVPVYQIH